MKATIQSVFVITLLYRLTLIGVAGDYSTAVLRLALYAVPPVIPLVVAGHALSKRISARRFRQYVYGLIALSGVSVLAKGMWTWLSS
jgi:cytochrome c biogenesis protein CcdA